MSKLTICCFILLGIVYFNPEQASAAPSDDNPISSLMEKDMDGDNKGLCCCCCGWCLRCDVNGMQMLEQAKSYPNSKEQKTDDDNKGLCCCCCGWCLRCDINGVQMQEQAKFYPNATHS